MTDIQPPPTPDSLLARGGGHAAAAGIVFQAQLGSAFAPTLNMSAFGAKAGIPDRLADVR